ncbi:MAG TPA: crossover junction endodeoxyribonuclease RuvC [Dehalococcoidia bacterium]|jgi:crossover junction endodeoxyribonuclease RuvC|nr:crossover junction endodeoxyribonuclease RuvC [Dehalococcoidia bacterium]|tara:strand:- start:54 stop:566 length:513 start_codon:yes stop_codon:yes gene_type:complete
MMILGIDPGTINMGYSVVSDNTGELKLEDYGIIKVSAKTNIEERLYQMHSHILNMINIFDPTAISVEEPFLGSGERKFVKSTIAIGQAQAAVLIAAASQKIPVFRYAPTKIKNAVSGYGLSDKKMIQDSVCTIFGLRETPGTDAADAIAISVCHAFEFQSTQLLESKLIN